ncbi:hypothetical protein LXA43DRAFT_588134 [Ganoderma leucocontextum]|nr:hypothetical protein LXA43DRAFT_588134 [Ganoderma leucocontextum]
MPIGGPWGVCVEGVLYKPDFLVARLPIRPPPRASTALVIRVDLDQADVLLENATMRCHKQPLAGEIQQMQLLQQLGRPELFWQPYPPQAMFNPWMAASQYPTAGPSPPSQLLSQVPSLGERPSWFQALVTAVSKEIKNDAGKKAAAGDVDERLRTAAPADLSAEDEKTLIDALRKHKEGGLTMQQVFEELSQKNGHPEIMWKTWFIANFEKLNSKVAFDPNVERPSAGGTRSTGLGSQGTSRTRSTSSNRPSRSSTIIVTDERSNSREESGSEWEWEELSDDQASTSHDSANGSTSRNAPPPEPRATTNGNTAPTARPARARRQPLRVTDADLRAMAQYRFEKGDDCEIRRYSSPRWREFAQRPENRKRSLAAWTCVPRVASHAAGTCHT